MQPTTVDALAAELKEPLQAQACRIVAISSTSANPHLTIRCNNGVDFNVDFDYDQHHKAPAFGIPLKNANRVAAAVKRCFGNVIYFDHLDELLSFIRTSLSTTTATKTAA